MVPPILLRNHGYGDIDVFIQFSLSEQSVNKYQMSIKFGSFRICNPTTGRCYGYNLVFAGFRAEIITKSILFFGT